VNAALLPDHSIRPLPQMPLNLPMFFIVYPSAVGVRTGPSMQGCVATEGSSELGILHQVRERVSWHLSMGVTCRAGGLIARISQKPA
jgi:hypothetical protein